MSDTHGAVFWTELMTRDCEAAMAYYGTVCGWEFTTVPDPMGGAYHIGLRNGEMIVGIMDMTRIEGTAGVPPHWLSYFAVDDLEQAVARTQAMGGKLLRPIFEVPGTGHIALIEDPTGAALGLMKPAPMQEGGTVKPEWSADSDGPGPEENFPV